MLGLEIAKYRLTRLLGQGGMGRVYLGVHGQIGSRVAIKLLAPEHVQSPEIVQRFFDEARAVNLIHHEHIVDVIDLDRLADGTPYIVMEYVEGASLATLLRAGRLPLAALAALMGEVLAALGAAHAAGVVHRDLKPDNVMVTPAGHAKVMDFGIAKLAAGVRPRVTLGLGPAPRSGPQSTWRPNRFAAEPSTRAPICMRLA